MSLSEPSVPSPSIVRTIAASWRRARALLRPTRYEGRITYSNVPSAPAGSALVVGVIDDPELAMRLLSVRGGVDRTSLDALAAAFKEVRDGSRLHLDLTDAEFSDRSVLSALAELLDALDDRRVHLRTVGLGRLATIPVD